MLKRLGSYLNLGFTGSFRISKAFDIIPGYWALVPVRVATERIDNRCRLNSQVVGMDEFKKTIIIIRSIK